MFSVDSKFWRNEQKKWWIFRNKSQTYYASLVKFGSDASSKRYNSRYRTSKQKKHISGLATCSTLLHPFTQTPLWFDACPFVKWLVCPLVNGAAWPLVLAWLHAWLFILCFFVPQQLEAIWKWRKKSALEASFSFNFLLYLRFFA